VDTQERLRHYKQEKGHGRKIRKRQGLKERRKKNASSIKGNSKRPQISQQKNQPKITTKEPGPNSSPQPTTQNKKENQHKTKNTHKRNVKSFDRLPLRQFGALLPGKKVSLVTLKKIQKTPKAGDLGGSSPQNTTQKHKKNKKKKPTPQKKQMQKRSCFLKHQGNYSKTGQRKPMTKPRRSGRMS